MNCAQCEQLREEIAYLKSELGLSGAQERRRRLRETLRVTPSEAAIIERLYDAKGRVVGHAALEGALPRENEERSVGIVKVHISRIRARVGEGIITNVWGIGYRMTSEGLQAISAVL